LTVNPFGYHPPRNLPSKKEREETIAWNITFFDCPEIVKKDNKCSQLLYYSDNYLYYFSTPGKAFCVLVCSVKSGMF